MNIIFILQIKYNSQKKTMTDILLNVKNYYIKYKSQKQQTHFIWH
jgi:hypothetical protein